MKIVLGLLFAASLLTQAKDNTPPEGFTALFNGKDLTGWQGLVELPQRNKDPEKYAAQIKAANEKYLPHWSVKDGVIAYDGKGQSLQTVKDYGDFELLVDWKIGPKGDSGIYLRGSPQVQIWDPEKNAGVGSGGLFNNQANPSKPIKLADKPIGEWNQFVITLKGTRLTVVLNGVTVIENADLPKLQARGPIGLQHHGAKKDGKWTSPPALVQFRNIEVKELN